MTIHRLIELATIIAKGEGGDLKCVVEINGKLEDVADLCLSKAGVLLIRT